MKFDHVVNYNGVYYKAGEEVPMKDVGVEKTAPSFFDSTENKEVDVIKYTAEQLYEMPVREIRRIAEENGFVLKKTQKDDIVQEFLEKQM